MYDIRKKLYNHLQALSARFYANNQVGQVISRVINDVEQTKDFIFNRVNEYLVRLYNNYYCTIHNVLLDVKLTLAALFIFPFYILTV